ncbi:MAG: hypothetical protein IJU79_06770 [Desulfovibrionaceae bacterium]|nr:hypothetical protein [Desulfovibrionaceae bacterium]
MAQLNQLIPNMVGIPEIRMSTMGNLLWIAWQGTLPAAINQTLENYGGMQIYCHEEQGQAIWFFFTQDVFLVTARLIIWGKFNELPVCVEVFPGRLQLDRKGEISLLMDASVQNQEVVVPDKLEVWVHAKSCENNKCFPGIEFELRRARRGMTNVNWYTPIVDMRMPFASTQSWLIDLHPLGSPLDKSFTDGWYAMYKRLNELFQEHKIKSITENFFVVLAIENLLALRAFMRDYLELIRNMDAAGTSWPCVIAVVDRANLNFSGDVPQKVNLHWDRLVPGFPYISYRNTYLLGKGFEIRDLHFSGDQMTMDEWCNIQLNDDNVKQESIPVLMAGKLTETIENVDECFFCGLSNHKAYECPTLRMRANATNVWDDIGKFSLSDINQCFQNLEQTIDKQGFSAYKAILNKGDDSSILLAAIFDIMKYAQLRNVETFWLYRMKEPEADERRLERDDSFSWEILDDLAQSSEIGCSQMIKRVSDLVEEHPRDPRLHTLAGFAFLGKPDYKQSIALFTRASMLTSNVALGAWNEFLAARVCEVQGNYGEAIQRYHKVARIFPDTLACRYRALVCRVKMGFGEQTLDELLKLIEKYPWIFNCFLIDPGLERGRILILSTLHKSWALAQEQAAAEKGRLRAMRLKFDEWFSDRHVFRKSFEPKLRNVERIAEVKNYIAFLKVAELRPSLENELNQSINKEIDDLRDRYKSYLNALQVVRDEFSWFPFPSALKEFGAEFNEAALILNKAYSKDFKVVEFFRESHKEIRRLDRLLHRLQRRLKSLRLVRDTTLFIMTMGKTFFVTEIIGLVLCIAFVIIVGFFGDILHLGWLKALISANKISILEVLVVIVSVLALGIAALRTTIIFDSRKERLVERAKQTREREQQARLNRIRKNKQKRLEAERMEREAEKQADLRRELRERMEE